MDFFERISFDGFENNYRILFTIIIVFLYLFYSYRGTGKIAGIRKKLILLLRVIIVTIITIIAGELSIRTYIFSGEKSDVAVLIDTSKSMSMKSYKSSLSRLDAIKKFVKENKELFENLGVKFNLNYYTFDTELNKISEEGIDQLEPEDAGTDIMKALKELLEKNSNLSGVLLFSDGNDTEGFQNAVSDFEFPVSVFTFSPGSAGERDIGLRNLTSSGFALSRENYEIAFEITMRGWRELTVPVTLSDEASVIKSERVVLRNGETKQIKMEFTPLKPGNQIYTIETPVYSGDDYPENNRISFSINVIRNQLRVLLLCGKPSWDLRFLRQVLKTNPWIDLVNFNILRTPFDLANIPEIELSLIPFPADEIFREGLDSFDVFIMQNFDPSQFVPSAYLRNVSQFVKSGGGLAIIGGTLLSRANFYSDTEMAEVVPVVGASGDVEKEFQLVPSNGTLNHPLNRIFLKYKKIPSLEFLNGAREIKPWAITLSEAKDSSRPVVVGGNYGKGKALAILTDSLWKLAFSPEKDLLAKDIYIDFWTDVLRWLSGESDEANILIETGKNEYNAGEIIKLNLRMLNKLYLPFKKEEAEINISDSRTGKSVYSNRWQIKKADHTIEFKVSQEGVYNISLVIRDGNRIIEKTEAKFVVRDKKGEMDSVFINDRLLKEIADRTDGQFYELRERIKKLDIKEKSHRTIAGETKKELWNSPVVFFSAILLFTIEWFLRRRWGAR